MRVSPILLASPLLFVIAAFACSDPAPSGTSDDEDAGEELPERKDAGSTDPVDAFVPPADTGAPAAPIFAHSGSTLFRFDATAKTVTEIGLFDCVPRNTSSQPGDLDNDAVIDLAVDRSGQIFATTFWRFIKVDPTNATCTVIRTDPQPKQYPNSLAFVPVGAGESLVGYAFDSFGDATIFTRIDLTTGTMTDIGNLNPTVPINGEDFGLSGDLVTVGGAAGKTYATIIQLTGDVGAGNDLLAELDPATGEIKQLLGNTAQKAFFGVGVAAGKPYGFAELGGIFELDVATGAATLALDAKDKNNQPITWFGAGAANPL
jgi:hypothetical protein